MSFWDPDKIRENSKNWTLEGDAKLLEFMESLSENLEKRCSKTQTNLNKMLLRANETRVLLGNTTNRLESLQNSQFVENRVYDEDETISNVNVDCDTEQSMKKQSIQSPMAAIQTAIDNSLKMMSECYEKVSLDLDDSDNEEDEQSAIINVAYRPREPYNVNPIPLLIGTQEWKEKWHLGLVESDAESVEENEVADAYSESSSDDPSISVSVPSNTPTMSESDAGSLWGLNCTGAATNSGPKRDIFQNSSDDEDTVNDNIYRPPKIIPSVKKEDPESVVPIAAKRTEPSSQKTDGGEQSIFREQQPTRIVANLFDDEPPEFNMPPENRPIAQQQQRRPLNLFADNDDDDDDEDEDLFQANRNVSVPYQQRNVNLFDDSPPSPIPVKKSEPNPVEKTQTQIKVVAAPRTKITNLFSDSDDSEADDFFVNSGGGGGAVSGGLSQKINPAPRSKSPEMVKDNSEKPNNSSQLKPSARITNIFDDEPPDDDLDIFIQSKKNNASTKPEPKNAKNLFDDVIDDDDDFTSVLSGKKSIDKKMEEPIKPPVVQAREKKVKNLFDDDDDEDNDIFRVKPPKDDEIKRQNVEKVTLEVDPVPQSINKVNHDQSDDLFVNEPQKGTIQNEITMIDDDEKQSSGNTMKIDEDKLVLPPPKNNINLFDDEEEPPIKIDDTNSDNLSTKDFDDKVENSPPHSDVPPTESLSSKLAKVTSIFDDFDVDDDDDLFRRPSAPVSHSFDEHTTPDVVEDSKVQSNDHEPIEEEGPPPLNEPEKLVKNNDVDENIDNNDDDDEDWLVGSTSNNIFDKFKDFKSPDETPPSPDQKPVAAKSTNAFSSFSPIGLFDDLPPDDVFPSASSSSKPLTNIYYDDTESFATRSSPSPPSSQSKSLPDSLPVDEKDEIDEVSQPPPPLSTDFKDRLGFFMDKPKDPIPTSPTKSPPKKLNMNFNINVGALLPGARPPPLVKTTANERIDDFTSEKELSTPTNQDENKKNNDVESTVKTTTSASTDSNILTSLAKTRPKIQTNRRPSTRKGRQANYRKTLFYDDFDDNEQPTTLPSSKSEPISITKQLENAQNVMSPVPPTIEQKKPVESKPISATLFDDENEEQLFKSKHVKSQPQKHVTLFSDDDQDDLFGSTSTDVVKEKKQKKPKPETTSQPKKPVESKSIFSSDEDSDILSVVATTKKPPQKKLQPTTSSNLFGSDDDDDDNIFGGTDASKASTSKSTLQKPKSSLFTKSNPTTTNKLFGTDDDDDDDDDDDLFKTKKKSGLSKFVPSNSPSAMGSKIGKRINLNETDGVGNDPLADLLQ